MSSCFRHGKKLRRPLDNWPGFAAEAGLGAKTVEVIAGEFEREVFFTLRRKREGV